MEEIYKDIEGYEGLYQVSNLGNVKSLKNNKTKKEKVLKLEIRNGYLKVDLCKNKTRKTYFVHRLVANAFLHNPHNYPCVNHKDECRTNNEVENLEWCTHKYNLEYNNGQKRRAESRSKKVYQYSKEGELISVFESISECGRNGYNFGHVSACCLGKRKTHKGFKWSYEPIE